jgi:hypothetical protein
MMRKVVDATPIVSSGDPLNANNWIGWRANGRVIKVADGFAAITYRAVNGRDVPVPRCQKVLKDGTQCPAAGVAIDVDLYRCGRHV